MGANVNRVLKSLDKHSRIQKMRNAKHVVIADRDEAHVHDASPELQILWTKSHALDISSANHCELEMKAY